MAARIAIDWAIEYALLGVERYGEYYEQGVVFEEAHREDDSPVGRAWVRVRMGRLRRGFAQSEYFDML